MEDSSDFKLTRRAFLITGATSVAAATLPSDLAARPSAARPVVSKVSFQVNGALQELDLDTRTTLLGICGVAAAIANAIYNATGVRVRDYPITLDKLLAGNGG